MHLRKYLPVLLIGLMVLAVGAVAWSCGSSSTPTQDAAKDGSKLDKQSNSADQARVDRRVVDKAKLRERSVVDGPVGDYGSLTGPFGCQVDADCFGQKCCPTPWGIKLCSPTCDLK